MNFLMLNVKDITISKNCINLVSLHSANCLGVYINDTLSLKLHTDFVLTKCCQRTGIFQNMISFFTNDVTQLHYNAFIKYCFFHSLMF